VTPGQIDAAQAVLLNPQEPLAENHQIALNFQTTDLKLTKGSSVDVPLQVFLGPKRRDMLEGDFYALFPHSYNQLLVSNTSFCGICAFPWLVDGLIKLLSVLEWIFHDWGLAIIVLVIIVRLLLHPISKRSQVSMMKMQKMGPEFERLKKKYGDDKEAFTKAQMQLYKEMGFTPVLGCLPMFLQMPIWFALYSALQSEFELRQAPFLWGWTWIHDLARPDRFLSFDAHSFTLPLIGLKIASLNILPLLMAVVFFLQQKYTPKPPASTPEQATQQKMMQYMTLLFPLFLYTAPSGLNLYILTSTGMGVLESKRIRDHIKQKEQEEKDGRITIETKATRQGKLNKKQELAGQAQAKPGCIAGWWQNLQQRVEEARRDAERRK
jgi:YidC/Oxa1 family membrane protein insertase